ncbi:hypothetical protein GH714_034199 [Hevea brasiliensis]|uniref:GCF C-terminal domain-containing protein n=1 Tax=Hevea brasiliensis TaxID=3981 RepID=A0A6A6MEW4_HEVBR|nr:hypothetical protein GH714_034199 [Hevea brasiliensis]
MSSSTKSRNFRRRGDDYDDNNDTSTNIHSSVPSSAVSRKPSASSSSSKPKKLLSFADDEDDDTPSSRISSSKSSASQKPSSRLTKPSSSHKLTASKDRLPPTPSSTASNEDPVSQTLKQSQQLGSEEEDQQPEDSNRNDAENRLASLGLGKSKDYSLIPDEETIKKIRAKRERMRQSRAAAPDYISLDGGSNHGAVEGLSDEEPEFRTRIAMIGKKETSSSTHGVFEDFDNDGDDNGHIKAMIGITAARYPNSQVIVEDGTGGVDDEDEEDKMWEEEQFRKGLGKRMDDGSASQGLDALSIPQQAEIATKALQDNIRRLKESHSRTVSSLTKTDENLSASLMNITALERSLSAAGEKFIFMQKLRDFVSVICEFLQHKAPYIEELEEQMQKLHEQRASAIVERRTADNDDEMMEVEAAVKAAMLVFSERGSSASFIAAATSAAQAASATMKEQANLPVKLDEFGRDINQQKRMDMKRRAEARHRRKARFESKRLSSMEVDGSDQKIEGESSTDESDSESAAYQSNRDLLLQTADQYLVMLLKNILNCQLLKKEDGSDLSPDDADSNLVPELVEKVAIPILHHEIAHCWDRLSTQETKNAVYATSLVTNYVPASSEALAELLVAIHARLADAVANIMVPTWSALVLKAVPNAARVAAYRFGMSVRLMKNICLWKDILALPILEKLALDELLCGKVLPHVRSIASNVHDAVTRTERIIASISGVWAGPSVTGTTGVTETETNGLARRLKKMLVELNDYDNARDIARTFSLREAL